MRALVTQKLAKDLTHQKQHGASLRSRLVVNGMRSQSNGLTGSTMLQHSCACGGNCPRCQALTALRGGGQPLPQSERAFFEPRFGTNFSQVRVHVGSGSAETASAVNARAFTLGQNIVFGAGQYQPGTSEGRHLLAHELTHVIQQRQTSPVVQCSPGGQSYGSKRSYREYRSRKARLNRLLKRIRRTRSKVKRKRFQILLLKKIYREILGNNPFKQIEIAVLRKTQTVTRGQNTYLITSGPAAQTEWIVPGNKSKGIKLTCDVSLFNDPLESIIVTAVHEAVHARHLLSGVPYTPHARPGRAFDYVNAVRLLSELDAYYSEKQSPFFTHLSLQRTTEINKFLTDTEKELKAALNKLKPKVFYAHYQRLIEKMLPKFKHLTKAKWFKTNPLPWQTTSS